MHNLALIDNQSIQNKIYTIRGVQVMIDRDLAILYGVETRRLNEQVKRNIERFPEEFMFQMTKEELENWMSQIATSNKETMGLRKMPFAFTEQGVSMLSSVLKSDTAIQTSIQIINTFVNMRKFISLNASIFQRLDNIETKQQQNKLESDEKFNKIFDAIEEKGIPQKQLQLDLQKHNAQYPKIEIEKFDLSHDRFLIIDDMDVYHFGASLKDLGKKWFAVSMMDVDSFEFLKRLK